MADETQARPYGELDAEEIASLVVNVKGGGLLDRSPADGERALLTIEGTFRFDAVKRVNGRLVRQLSVKVEKLAEPMDELADEVERFIAEVADRQEGRQQLPFDEDGDEDGDRGDRG